MSCIKLLNEMGKFASSINEEQCSDLYRTVHHISYIDDLGEKKMVVRNFLLWEPTVNAENSLLLDISGSMYNRINFKNTHRLSIGI